MLRDVGGGVTQSQARFKISAERFGDHGAGTVSFELVDHHAVEAGEAPRFVGGRLASLAHAPGSTHPPDRAVERSWKVEQRIRVVGLRLTLQNQRPSAPVK